ncbi:hypothetical protein [Pseudomonas sp. Q1-7]|uniref:hypothetical protein n=1 Tax=Pseudomonas sp. Q1-7 TaxID=3020843 RepID=UPI0022FFC912|nr:hypothetical protein [Pseudomonas sp. Q1-7]
MGNLIKMPEPSTRRWRIAEPSFRELMLEDGVAPEHVDVALGEMRRYFLACDSQEGTTFSLPDINVSQEDMRLIDEAVTEAFERHNAISLQRHQRALDIILRLVSEKYSEGDDYGAA